MGPQIELKLGVREDSFPPRRFTPPALIDSPMKTRGHPSAVKARPAILPRDIPAEDAFRLTLLQCQWHIAANISAVVEGREAEGLHQMRVGFRRLRVAFTSFGCHFRNAELGKLRDRAKRMAEHLGPARDLDVFMGELLEPAAEANGAVESFELLRGRANEARRTAWNFAVTHVLSPAFAGFMADLNGAVERRIWQGHSKNTFAFDEPAQDVAAQVLSHRLKAARKRAKHLGGASDQQVHRLRIALKKLRYTGEFFAPLFDKDSVEEFGLGLSKMQDSLGAVHDVIVARETLARLTAGEQNGSGLSFAAGIVYGWHLDRATHIFKKSVKRWKKFAHTEPFWTHTTKH
ncbi:MAG: CHAD domain-containing protein [Proteobacteria bacterium]|nr:CHAD domain-containing protein [Pseudomonadota bacterium]